MPNIITRGAMSAKAVGFTGQTTTPVYIEDVFSTYLYTGTGSDQVLTTGIDLSTKGGLVWSKRRSNLAESHFLQDTLRGLTARLSTNNTNAQTSSGAWPMNALSATGMTVSGANYAAAGETYVSWTFREQAKFFDVVTFSTDASGAATFSHALSATPGMVIIKRTSSAEAWYVYHRSLTTPNNYYLNLNTTSPETNAGFSWITVSSSSCSINGLFGASSGYVAYLFADSNSGGFGAAGTDSVVACGSFTYGFSGDVGVDLGWEPQWLLVKQVDSSTGPWWILDTMRGYSAQQGAGTLSSSTGGSASALFANLSNAEVNYTYGGLTSTGFRWASNFNGGTGTTKYIYLAIRRGPMKTPTDATKVFLPVTTTATGAYSVGFPIDSQICGYRLAADSYNWTISDRFRGVSSTTTQSIVGLLTPSTAAESTIGANGTINWTNTSFTPPTNLSGVSSIYWNFRRAPGFFDVVCYTGTGSARTVAHNLGVVPELMIVKRRDGAGTEWCVYSQSILNNQYLVLNTSAAKTGVGALTWNSTTPTASVFSLGTYSGVNASGGTYVAYLFATCPGVSKCGSYTGTGAAQNIDCGFASSARFILIKRTDSTGDWWVYDSARGISASNDPYLFLNSTAAEVTNTNYVDAFASGFTLTSSAPAGLNANGGSYIFLAVA